MFCYADADKACHRHKHKHKHKMQRGTSSRRRAKSCLLLSFSVKVAGHRSTVVLLTTVFLSGLCLAWAVVVTCRDACMAIKIGQFASVAFVWTQPLHGQGTAIRRWRCGMLGEEDLKGRAKVRESYIARM